MNLLIPTFANPFDRSAALANAYGRISALSLWPLQGRGDLKLDVHPNAGAVLDAPVATLGASLGATLSATATFPSLAVLMEDAEFAAAYATIEAKLYAALASNHPLLVGATIVP